MLYCDFYVSAGDMWICKPTGSWQGKGIFLVRDVEKIKRLIAKHQPDETGRVSKPMKRIIQR